MPYAEKKSASAKTMSVLCALAFIGTVTVNALANILPLNGVNTGTLSDEIPNLFVPAALTFSIWALIYILLAGYVIAAIRESFGRPKGERAWTAGDGAAFLANMAANIGWIFAWHWRAVILSMILMLVILVTLIILEQGNQGKFSAGGALAAAAGKNGQEAGKASGMWRGFFLTAPLRVYLGWISVATIANATAVLVKTGWNGFGVDPRVWTVIVIAAGLAVALGFSLLKGQIAAPLVIAWAYIGIVLKRTQTDPDYSTAIWIAASAAIVIILLSLILRKRPPKE